MCVCVSMSVFVNVHESITNDGMETTNYIIETQGKETLEALTRAQAQAAQDARFHRQAAQDARFHRF